MIKRVFLVLLMVLIVMASGTFFSIQRSRGDFADWCKEQGGTVQSYSPNVCVGRDGKKIQR